MTEINPLEVGVIRDLTDLRDVEYRSTLRSLPATVIPRCLGFRKNEPARIQIRDQGESPCCTGYALASLIDYLRLSEPRGAGGASAAPPAVSAAMLYRMGWLISAELSSHTDDRMLSIRSVIKGFYHNGVCPDAQWPSDDRPGLNIERAKSARQITLGAYFRVLPFLSNYHCALDEVGAILVSAHTHDGWSAKALRTAGQIVRPATLWDAGHGAGAHAFVIVGYDERGFFVLNSWGKSWGGRCGPGGAVLPGVAHWRYDDWADSIIDAWVLRLAVPTPGAFEYTLGPQGRMPEAEHTGGAMGSVPRLYTLGHYVHFEHGGYVQTGGYASSRESLEQTLEYIGSEREADLKSVDTDTAYVRIVGDTADVGDAMRRIASLRRRLRPVGVYPLSLLWLARTASAFSLGIRGCMAEAVRRMPAAGENRDRLIEFMVADLGWPLWQQSQRDAERVAESGGPLDLICTGLKRKRLRGRKTLQLYLTFEGVGALVFVALLNRLKEEAADYFSHVARITLTLPTVTAYALVEALQQADPHSQLQRKMLMIVPDEQSYASMKLPPYQKSWFDLVDNSFQPRRSLSGGSLMMLPRAALAWTPGAPPLQGMALRKMPVSHFASTDSEDCTRDFLVSNEVLACILDSKAAA